MSAKQVPVAVQLYSLRTVAPKDVAGTLRAVAEMGYTGVELAGYYDLSGEQLRRMLDDCGLRCAGAHVGLNALEGEAFDRTVALHQALGNDRLIVPSADLTNLEPLIARLNAAHARARQHGMRVGFHNHTNEFELLDGKTKLDGSMPHAWKAYTSRSSVRAGVAPWWVMAKWCGRRCSTFWSARRRSPGMS